MKTIRNIFNKVREQYKTILLVLVLGIFAGWLIFHPSKGSASSPAGVSQGDMHDHAEETIYTCSMHPQIRQDHPGTCPICAMDLVPVSALSGSMDMDEDVLTMTEAAAGLADIRVVRVKQMIPERSVRLQGTVVPDERKTAEITARFGGRVEKLFVNFTGQQVRKGEKLASLYSPELVAAQQELLEAIKLKESNPSYYQAARTKLKFWDLGDQQVDAIEKAGEPMKYVDILAPMNGTVMQRHVKEGDYVREGSGMFEVVDLSSVWVMFDAYEEDIPWLGNGMTIHFTTGAVPGEIFEAPVTFIDPLMDRQTRVARVRVEMANASGQLKPGMFVEGNVKARMSGGMQLVIPRSAVLWTGDRSVVYVKQQDAEAPTFAYREIMLGAEAGENYIVKGGLEEGEVIAANGVFKIDAAAQLEGKKSMMMPVAPGKNKKMDMNMDDVVSTSIRVGGECGMCKDRIEETVTGIPGVYSGTWDKNSKILTLSYDKNLDLSEVHHAIAAVGHDTELERAPDSVYEALPACCLYERFEYN